MDRSDEIKRLLRAMKWYSVLALFFAGISLGFILYLVFFSLA